jgi:hypothetical protein
MSTSAFDIDRDLLLEEKDMRLVIATLALGSESGDDVGEFLVLSKDYAGLER